ncbi:TIGR01777 family protein [Winogradskyella echinorum]|uniref:TIGR01777 family protein n=1 Tax=Winogradskyella echinorum TaxID=538189 RepID=A0ABR6XWS1_9FLAO|nr:TIGR01777 family oxidoreductase [Winogradskyella echinorum]MBC3844879.1 TIGR01777 family protein [Winogradskyella echinorum]MBC5749227.1 TIGR01777 family protein [Winogradskyella echinorum]
MTVLITGATGLIGQEIVKQCHAEGKKVNYLTTSKSKLSTEANYKGFYWNPKENLIDHKCFEGVTTIINMVGASISKRWTDDYKKEILESRTKTAQLLSNTIKTHNYKIDQVVSASAIGIYPTSLVNYYEEDNTEVSESFLGKVVYQWEAAVDDFKALGCKVAKIRIGLVLAKDGGALPEIVKPIKYGAGAAFGSGKQWQSWIHVKDLASLFVFAVQNNFEGIYNGVAPNPVSNKELTKAAASVLKRPLILPNIPKFAMKLVLGEMHILLFESQRVSSQKTEAEGFHFKYANLRPALEDIL